MTDKERKRVAQSISAVAVKLAARGFRTNAGELRRIAQVIQETPLGDGESKITVDKADGPPMTQEFKSHSEKSEELEDLSAPDESPETAVDTNTEEMPMDDAGELGEDAIRDFDAAGAEGKGAVDEKKTHTLTVTLKAPDDITEANMMNFVLGIGPELGVDVGSFKWSKSEDKSEEPVMIQPGKVASVRGFGRYAQYLEEMQGMGQHPFAETGQGTNMGTQMGMGGFDPSQEMGIQDFADHSEDVEASSPQAESPHGSTNPHIDSFVKMPNDSDAGLDSIKTHTCSVTFKAPEDVSEAEMMNYILGIGRELRVDVDSFKWSKQDIKPPAAR